MGFLFAKGQSATGHLFPFFQFSPPSFKEHPFDTGNESINGDRLFREPIFSLPGNLTIVFSARAH
jgi:hypothetical protein